MLMHKYENFPLCAVMLFPILVFWISPSHLSEQSFLPLNQIMNDYLLGNGYYLPSNYPFAAKITNNFSVIFSIVTALVWGLVRLIYRFDYQFSKPEQFWKVSAFILFLAAYFLYKSLIPQEFSVAKGRNGILTENFHNHPIGFLFFMICKNTLIYYGVRWLFVIPAFLKHKTRAKF